MHTDARADDSPWAQDMSGQSHLTAYLLGSIVGTKPNQASKWSGRGSCPVSVSVSAPVTVTVCECVPSHAFEMYARQIHYNFGSPRILDDSNLPACVPRHTANEFPALCGYIGNTHTQPPIQGHLLIQYEFSLNAPPSVAPALWLQTLAASDA